MADLISMMSAAAGLGGEYEISRSLRFNSADSAYLNRTPASAGNQQLWTWSGWVKISNPAQWGGIFNAGSSGNQFAMYLYSDSTLYIQDYTGSNNILLQTTQVFRDPSAWYHILLRVNTTLGTGLNRVRLYVNGVQVTAFASSTYPSQNYNTQVNSTSYAHNIGLNYQFGTSNAKYFSGYMAEVHFVDGFAFAPTAFGEFNSDTGVWQPKAYTGSYGTNGFYLDFSDNSGTTSTTLGKDSSGNGNNWTPNNFSVTAGAGNDSLVDSPTRYGTDTGAGGEVRGNYATLNALDKNSQIALANGNLDYTNSSSNANTQARATIAYPGSGKWYFESTRGSGGSSFAAGIGTSTTSLGSQTAGIIQYNEAGQIYVDGVLDSTPGTTFANGDVMGVAVDMDVSKVYWYKNGSVINASGLSFTVGSSTWMPMIGCYTNGDTGTLNFGQRAFAYTAPSGFKALCTQNLPEPTIVDGGEYFNTVLWTGDGTSSRAITGLGFQPDLVWGKVRSTNYGNVLYDAVRGADKRLSSNSTDPEDTISPNTNLISFDSDGFTVGSAGVLNESTQTYVAWNWKANGAGVSNTAGTITSTVSVNTTSGFSIVTYTGNGTAGATVGHGLGAVPSMIIVKNRDAADAWQVYHAANTANPETDYLVLNTTAATADAADRWNDTLPTSTVFSIGNGVEVNTNTEDYVAYVFAQIAGYSAFGSYTGNGSTDGPFVFLNFRPAFVMLKRTDSTSNWTILDFAREGYNVDNDPLYPNLSNAEGTTDLADLLSNGFKLRSTDASVNASGGTYIYAAFCSNPFVYSLAR